MSLQFLLYNALKGLYECVPDDLALLFRVGHPGQTAQEQFRGVHDMNILECLPAQRRADLRALVLAQKAGVHEHRVQTIADGPVKHGGRDQRIHAAGDADHDVRASYLPAHLGNYFSSLSGHAPVLPRLAYAENEILQDLCAVYGMRDLGMELDTVEIPLFREYARVGAIFGGCGARELFRQSAHVVAVGKPDGLFCRQTFEYPLPRVDLKDLLPEFLFVARLHLAPQKMRQKLFAVANAEDRDAQIEDGLVRHRAAFLQHGRRPAGKNEAVRFQFGDLPVGNVVRHYLRPHSQIAHAPSNQMGELASEVEDEDHFFISRLCSSVLINPHFFHFLPLPQGQGSFRPILPPETDVITGITTGLAVGAPVPCAWPAILKTFAKIQPLKLSQKLSNSLRDSSRYSTS